MQDVFTQSYLQSTFFEVIYHLAHYSGIVSDTPCGSIYGTYVYSLGGASRAGIKVSGQFVPHSIRSWRSW